MRLLLLTLLLSLSLFARADDGTTVKPKVRKKKTVVQGPQAYPRTGQCVSTCDTITSRVTYVDEGIDHCGLNGDYLCPAVVGEYCTANAVRSCVLMDKGYCAARCELDGKTLAYDDHCNDGFTCVKNQRCSEGQRDRNFARASCH